jgi:hypothetical protein
MVNTRVFLFSGETFKVAENAEEHGINWLTNKQTSYVKWKLVIIT